LQQVPYVIVPETASPHHTRGSAQRLPDLPFFGVIGAIAPGDTTDYYRLAASSITEAVDFALTSTQPGSAVPLQIQLFDSSGQLLGLWNSGGQGSATVHFELSMLPTGSALYLGISATNPLGAKEASGAIDYQLWIGRSSAVDRSTAGLGAASPLSPSALTPISTLPLTTVSGSGVPAAPGASQAARAAGRDDASSLRGVVGSPEIRSASPSAGLLSDRDRPLHSGTDFRTTEPQSWGDPASGMAATEPGGQVESTAAATPGKGDADLVVIRGPGGFPLLGAVAIGHRRKTPGGPIGDPARPLAVKPREPRIAWDLQPIPELPPPQAGDASAPPALSRAVRGWGGFPFSTFSGLGVAAVMTLNAVLSQPMAGFDYLTSHMDVREPRTPTLRRRGRR